MRDFEESPSCDKCGAYTPNLQYRDLYQEGHDTLIAITGVYEYLACSCFKCKYTWDMKVKPTTKVATKGL